MAEGRLDVDPARPFSAFRHTLVQTGQAPLREGDADYRDLQRVRTGGSQQSSPSLGRGLFLIATER
jgi:hypothetical protein